MTVGTTRCAELGQVHTAFMACAHAKFTGEVGVCMATSGPGAIHRLQPPEIRPKEDDLRTAADILNAGERVAILVGFGATSSSDERTGLAQRHAKFSAREGNV